MVHATAIRTPPPRETPVPSRPTRAIRPLTTKSERRNPTTLADFCGDLFGPRSEADSPSVAARPGSALSIEIPSPLEKEGEGDRDSVSIPATPAIKRMSVQRSSPYLAALMTGVTSHSVNTPLATVARVVDAQELGLTRDPRGKEKRTKQCTNNRSEIAFATNGDPIRLFIGNVSSVWPKDPSEDDDSTDIPPEVQQAILQDLRESIERAMPCKVGELYVTTAKRGGHRIAFASLVYVNVADLTSLDYRQLSSGRYIPIKSERTDDLYRVKIYVPARPDTDADADNDNDDTRL